MTRIRIGTRGSSLALIQAGKVRDALLAHNPNLEIAIEVISTRGDRETAVPLHMVSTTGVFVKEIEQALFDRHIDIAVHSLKDMPASLPGDLTISAVLERDDPCDALVRPRGASGGSLAGNETVATSSLRRKAQLLSNYPDLTVVDIRGNIETRLSKLDGGMCDATILAACGMDRSGYSDRIAHRFSIDEMLPAACQGIIAVEQRSGDGEIAALLDRINHPETFIRAAAERAFLAAIEGGCKVPAACYSEIVGTTISITGLIAMEDGSAHVRRSLSGDMAESEPLGEALADDVLSSGGREILQSYGR